MWVNLVIMYITVKPDTEQPVQTAEAEDKDKKKNATMHI